MIWQPPISEMKLCKRQCGYYIRKRTVRTENERTTGSLTAFVGAVILYTIGKSSIEPEWQLSNSANRCAPAGTRAVSTRPSSSSLIMPLLR